MNNTEGYLEEAIGFLEGGVSECVIKVTSADVATAGQLQTDYCTKLRKIAAAAWYIHNNTSSFFKNLFLSAECRSSFLVKKGAEQNYYFSINYITPLEDAIISNNRNAIIRIAEASQKIEHINGHYTDKAYYQLLSEFAINNKFTKVNSSLIDRLLDDTHSLYKESVECLVAIDQIDASKFENAFLNWCNKTDVKPPSIDDIERANIENQDIAEEFINELDNKLFFSGLAIATLAKRNGIMIIPSVLTDCGLKELVDAA